MSTSQKFMGFLALSCVCCAGAEPKNYAEFQRIVGTNTLMMEIRSPSLVDTNNKAVKWTNSLASLAVLNSAGELGGLRLGMTMEEAFARWGKPRSFYSMCLGGGPRLFYGGGAFIDLVQGSNYAKTIKVIDSGGVARSAQTSPPAVQDCLRILGKPSRREYAESGRLDMIYARTNMVIRLECDNGLLFGVEIDAPPAAVVRNDRL